MVKSCFLSNNSLITCWTGAGDVFQRWVYPLPQASWLLHRSRGPVYTLETGGRVYFLILSFHLVKWPQQASSFSSKIVLLTIILLGIGENFSDIFLCDFARNIVLIICRPCSTWTNTWPARKARRWRAGRLSAGLFSPSKVYIQYRYGLRRGQEF